MTFQKLSISVLVLAAACVPVSASAVIYCSTSDCGSDNQTAFNNATTSLFFPNAPILFATAGLSADTTTYTDSVSGTEFIDDNSAGTSISSEGFNSPIGAGLKIFTPGETIEVTLPANVYAFSTSIQDSSTGGICVETGSSFSRSSCSTDVFLPTANTAGFIGVVSASPITTVWLGAPSGGQIQLNNFQIGEQGPSDPPDTPEIATMIMIGTGLISLGVMRRRRSI
jgi:hypothetical protein